MEAVDLKDGLWHASTALQSRAIVKNRFGRDMSRIVYRARIFRHVDGKVEQDCCPHNHYKRSVADECAQSTCRRWNKEGA